MASSANGSPAPEAASDSNEFTLQIISPSLGVPQPFVLEKLSPSTTIQQLKGLIRNAVDAKPTDQAQRLIHRGRLLAREGETLLQVFGQEALRSSERQSLHLVLRDLSDGQAAFAPTPPVPVTQTTGAVPIPIQQPAGSQGPQSPQAHHQHRHNPQAQQHGPPVNPLPQVQVGTGPQPHVQTMLGSPHNQQPGPQLPPGLGPRHQQHLLELQRQLAMRTPMFPTHAMPGMPNPPGPHGRGTPSPNMPGGSGSPVQPDATRTVVREGVGPNGQQWRITVNESISRRPGGTASPFSSPGQSAPWASRPVANGGNLSGNDVQNIIRGADGAAATRTMTDAMNRHAGTSSLANLSSSQTQQPIQPGVTIPFDPSRDGNATRTPDARRPAGRSTSAPAGQNQAQSSSATPEVFILASPEGPRALLLNTSLDMYYTPRRSRRPHRRPSVPPALGGNQHGPFGVRPQINHDAPAWRTIRDVEEANRPYLQQLQQQQLQQQQHQPQQHQAQIPHVHAVARPDNAQVQAVRIAQIWPHIWMIIRLGLFIWWFTSPTSSWSRWFTVITIAITLFLINTGLLNPLAEHLWVPFRQHIENMIPLAAEHPRRPENAQGGNNEAVGGGGQRDPDPAEAAARLVQQRREDNANWLLNTARRLERAGILFLASIAPGLAERHIAQVEAEARLARQRQQEAAAAAEAAATAAAEAENATNGEQSQPNVQTGEAGPSNTTQTEAQHAVGSQPGQAQPAA
ncbi:hypothetical protein F4780DRAFT_254166 [Xylariomycetidae sp. FL0641]|nr:hypothetical protein F4780DRAFT_254166 [Xylariomycetidae sp. FL0641]